MIKQITTCQEFKVGGDAPDSAYAVEAFFEDGKTAYHQGPNSCAFFTKEEASKLALAAFLAGEINTEYWVNARGGKFAS